MVETLKIPAHQPTAVGAMLKEEFLEPLGITQGKLAKAMGVGRKTVNELCGGRRGVTADLQFWQNIRHTTQSQQKIALSPF